MIAASRIPFMGCDFDSMTEEQALQQCLAWRDQPRRSHTLITVNVSILMMMRGDARLRDSCLSGDVVVADGVPIVWATRLGYRLAGRVCGCDLMARLLAEGGQHRLRVFFLGATEEIVTRLVDLVHQKHPGIEVVGYRNGYFSQDESSDVIWQVRQSRADVLFVGMPTPFKETWCDEHREALCTPAVIGVGGSFDVLTGFVRRAPRWMQSVGLEWFWRFLMEPRRMWKRYLVTNTQFLYLFARMLLDKWFGQSSSRPSPPPKALSGRAQKQRMASR